MKLYLLKKYLMADASNDQAIIVDGIIFKIIFNKIDNMITFTANGNLKKIKGGLHDYILFEEDNYIIKLDDDVKYDFNNESISSFIIDINKFKHVNSEIAYKCRKNGCNDYGVNENGTCNQHYNICITLHCQMKRRCVEHAYCINHTNVCLYPSCYNYRHWTGTAKFCAKHDNPVGNLAGLLNWLSDDKK